MYFEMKPDRIGEWRWRLRADNHKIIADSGEGYKNEADCLKGIRLVQASWDAEIRREPFNALAALMSPDPRPRGSIGRNMLMDL